MSMSNAAKPKLGHSVPVSPTLAGASPEVIVRLLNKVLIFTVQNTAQISSNYTSNWLWVSVGFDINLHLPASVELAAPLDTSRKLSLSHCFCSTDLALECHYRDDCLFFYLITRAVELTVVQWLTLFYGLWIVVQSSFSRSVVHTVPGCCQEIQLNLVTNVSDIYIWITCIARQKQKSKPIFACTKKWINIRNFQYVHPYLSNVCSRFLLAS